MIKKIRIRGKLKGFFFLSGLHWFVPSGLLLFIAHLSKLSRWIKKHRHIPGSDYYSFSFHYNKRFELFEQVIKSQNIDNHIDYLEFGVARGHSFKWWIGRIRDDDSRFYGFDTFSGLPEDWGPFKKGDMHNEGEPPVIDDQRHTFYQGLFQQTLPGFIKTYHSTNRRIIHMDADLYSSTLFVLSQLTPVLKPGDILFFDEFNVPLHEWRAFSEWTEAFYISCEVLGSVNNFYQVAIIIK